MVLFIVSLIVLLGGFISMIQDGATGSTGMGLLVGGIAGIAVSIVMVIIYVDCYHHKDAQPPPSIPLIVPPLVAGSSVCMPKSPSLTLLVADEEAVGPSPLQDLDGSQFKL